MQLARTLRMRSQLGCPSKFDSTYAQPAYTQPTYTQPTHTQPTWPYPRNSTQLARSLRIRSQLGHILEIRLLIEAVQILLRVPSHQI
jgi:hypothetical protein